MTNYAQHLNLTPPTQRQPLDARMTPNDAGGYGYAVDDATALDRFLILGAEGGTYYASEPTLTRDVARRVLALLAKDPAFVVARLTEVSVAGRAPKPAPALFVLALALASDNPTTRQYAYTALPKVCRTGTHLFDLLGMLKALGRKWSRGLQTAVRGFYQAQRQLDYSLVKYQQRNGWSHKDVLRLAHVKPWDYNSDALFKWAVGKGLPPSGTIVEIAALLRDTTIPLANRCAAITRYRVPREAIPSELLTEPDVWRAMLTAGMPLTAMLRNLGTMSKIGVLTPGNEYTQLVCAALTDADALTKARVHPMAVMLAAATYTSGAGRSASWPVVPAVGDALADAFIAAFGAVEPTGLRYLSCVDWSASMNTGIAGTSISCREAAAALALVDVAAEPKAQAVAFGTGIQPLALSKRMRVSEALGVLPTVGEGTDCAVPIRWARARGIAVDVFVQYTDSQTWAGSTHVMAELKAYRQATGIPAKLAVVNLAVNGTSVADPQDAGCLNLVGLDTGTPAALRAFALGFGTR